MSLFAPSETANSKANQPRRALIVVDAGESLLARLLAEHGYATDTATITSAPWLVKSKAPDLVILELYQGQVGGTAEALYLARRLRAEPESYATPIIIAWNEEQESLRRAALYMGADDYFSLTTPIESILARFDSLFWRKEAGRRSATLIGDQKLEIENYVLLTDAVRWDMESGWEGTLALIQPLNRESQAPLDRAAVNSALTSIYGFLKLQMRRMDSVVFYDASTLLAYMPHLSTPMAIGALTRLRGEFLEAQKSCDMAVGLVSFPSDGNELEDLLEKAETCALQAHNNSEYRRVVAYGGGRAESNPILSNQAETATPEPEKPPVPEEPKAVEAEENIAPGPTAIAEPTALPAFAQKVVPEIPAPPEQRSIVAPPVPLPTSPFSAAETFNAETSELPDFARVEPQIQVPVVNGLMSQQRVASAHEIEQSLRPTEHCRLLLAVSRPERMAQLNTLVRSAGYEVRPAFDGPHALGLLRIDRPDIMLLDYDVRGLNGLETLHRIQAQHNGRLPVPVILLISQISPEIKAEAEALGVVKIINHPYAPIELLAAMRQAVSAS